MNTEEKTRLKQYFEKMLDSLEDGEIHIVPLKDGSEETDGDDDAV